MAPLTALDVTELFRAIARRLAAARAELGVLDGAIGDADHGNSMAEGFAAVVRACGKRRTRAPLPGICSRSPPARSSARSARPRGRSMHAPFWAPAGASPGRRSLRPKTCRR